MTLRSGAGQQIVGVISDTHGLLRPEVLRIFKGVTLILHAGDIGSPEVLDGLRDPAPVVAVRGNNDTGEWAKRIPEVKAVKASGVSIYMNTHPSSAELQIRGRSGTLSVPARAFGVVQTAHPKLQVDVRLIRTSK